ncbi:MAG TPA: hypothetical protein VGT03_06425 [Candidatus Acidoferrales bacterium]|nr:hypothetical protein [Candidatus Acidoferrales bacterium]
MENRSSGIVRGRLALPLSLLLMLDFLGLSASLIPAGCAAPGAPIARQPVVAEGINDLAAQQTGNSVVLTFTAPKETVQGIPLQAPPEIRIYREFLATPRNAGETAQPPTPQQLILTVTSQTEMQYREGNRLRIPTAVGASDVTAHAGEDAVFMVRTRISTRDSADSNLTAVHILPAAGPIEDLHAHVTKSAIELTWTAPQIPPAGTLGPAVIRYRIYRTQVKAASPLAGSAGRTGQSIPAAAYLLLGETASLAFDDASFTFGLTYQYTVRSVAHYNAGEVESEDSKPLEVTPRDTFPPAAPKGLIAAVVPASGSEASHIDLSWDISPESDVSGYNVYRSEAELTPGNQMNPQLLLTPTFRDISVVSGHQYFYRVTAVDRSGNESVPSAAIAVTLPGPNEQEKE